MYLDLVLAAAVAQQVPSALGACLNSYASIDRREAAEQVEHMESGHSIEREGTVKTKCPCSSLLSASALFSQEICVTLTRPLLESIVQESVSSSGG